MPSAVTDYGCAQWAGLLVGVGTLPASFYVALCAGTPGTGWDGTMLATIEPVDTAYARQPLGIGSANWVSSGTGLVANANVIDFGVPVNTWGPLTHFGLCDAASGGNVWAFGQYTNPPVASADFDVQIPAGGIVLAAANLLHPVSG